MRFGITAFLFGLLSQQLFVSAKGPSASDLDESYTFEKYVVDFEKVYDDKDEYQKRKEIFEKRITDILKHNNAYFSEDDVPHRPGYFMNANHLTDLEDNEIPKGYDKTLSPGWTNQAISTTSVNRDLFTSGEKYKYEMELPFTCDDISTLPKEVDWRQKKPSVVTPVKNQGPCGSCWTFGSVTALETQIAIKKHQLHVLAEEEPLSCAKNPDQCGGKGGCSGSTVEISYEYISKHGIHTNHTVPYDAASNSLICPNEDKKRLRGLVDESHKYSMKGFAVLPENDEKCLMNAVAKHGSVAIAVAATLFQFYDGGIFDEPNKGNVDMNHAVTLEGYGTEDGVDYWLVRNSWGANWGENGYIRIKRDNTCGYDNTPLDGMFCKYEPNGKINPVHPIKVCGVAGVKYHSVIPIV